MKKALKFTDEELWDKLKKNKRALSSVREWNEYAKANSLPHSQTLIKRFGSWNELKKAMELEVNGQHRPQKYDAEELKTIIENHKEAYKSINAWNQYAKQHQLPSHQVFERYLGLKELEGMLNTQFVLTKEHVCKQIKEHFPDKSPTVSQWIHLSKGTKVVSSSTIIRLFGSWRKMKYQVYRE